MTENGDRAIHGGSEDTASDTEAALRRRIAQLETERDELRNANDQWARADVGMKARITELKAEAMLGSEIKSGFHDHTTQQLWTEEQCRTMLNAALMYLASVEPDAVLRLPLDKILHMAEQTDGLAMSLSDDDKVLSIIAQAKH